MGEKTGMEMEPSSSKISDEACMSPTAPPAGEILDATKLEKRKKSSFADILFVEERNVQRPTTDFETLVHLFKGNVGSGYLALPNAVMHSGLWVGLAGIPFIGLLCVHCMNMILECSQQLCRRTGKASLNYEETVKMSLECGPMGIRKWSRVFNNIAITFLVLTQLGFCCVYFVFISQNIYQAAVCISSSTKLTQFDYLAITLIPMLLVCYIKDLKYLVPVSSVANISQIFSVVIIIYYLVRDLPEVEMKVPAFAGWAELPLFLGTAVYAFEGIGLILPLENHMKYPSHFPGKTGVLNTGMLIIVCLYTAIGFFGYVRYGDTVLGSITLNLPGDEILAQIVKILMSLAIFLTYPLQFYVALSIMLPSVLNRFSSKRAKVVVEYGFRSFLVVLTFILASVIPDVALLTNLVGAVCSSTLALIIPAFVDTITFWPNNGKYNWKLAKNLFVGLVGVLSFITGAIMSVKDIVKFLEEEDHTLDTGC